MKYIYCASTYSIFLGLQMVQEGNKVCFLYSRKKYKELFDTLGVKAIYIKNPSRRELFNPFLIKKRIRRINALLKNNELHFTHLQFSAWLFIILFNRLKGGKNFFYNYEPITQNAYSFYDIWNSRKNFIIVLFQKIFYAIFYKSKLKISYYGRSFFLSLNKKHFCTLNIEEIVSKEPFEKMQHHVVKNIQIKHNIIENLYIGQNEGVLKGKVYSEGSIKNIYRFINDEGIAVKPHPAGYPAPNTGRIINPHIPTEFLFNSVQNSIISINSTTLISASHYYNNKSSVKIICLMKLVDYFDKDSEKEMMRRIVSRSKDNIHFPETFSELKKLLR